MNITFPKSDTDLYKKVEIARIMFRVPDAWKMQMFQPRSKWSPDQVYLENGFSQIAQVENQWFGDQKRQILVVNLLWMVSKNCV